MTLHPSVKFLQQWLDSIDDAHLEGLSGTIHVDVLAHANRDRIDMLLADLAVQEAIDRSHSRASGDTAPSERLEVIKSILVDACWLHRLSEHGQEHPALRETTSSTRTEMLRDVQNVARKASSLANDLAALSSVTGRALTWSHLRKRYDSGNRDGFISSRKGWANAIVNDGPSIPDLLRMLAADLNEEAALLKRAMTNNRQTGGGLRGIYPLIDALCKKTLQLGNRDSSGAPCPDLQLVHSVLTSLMPDGHLDESTLRRRWNRQGKPKPKPA